MKGSGSSTPIIVTSIICITIFAVGGTIAAVSVARYEKQAEINAQTEVEKTKIEQENALLRTKERMNAVPWYKGGENKD